MARRSQFRNAKGPAVMRGFFIADPGAKIALKFWPRVGLVGITFTHPHVF